MYRGSEACTCRWCNALRVLRVQVLWPTFWYRWTIASCTSVTGCTATSDSMTSPTPAVPGLLVRCVLYSHVIMYSVCTFIDIMSSLLDWTNVINVYIYESVILSLLVDFPWRQHMQRRTSESRRGPGLEGSTFWSLKRYVYFFQSCLLICRCVYCSE